MTSEAPAERLMTVQYTLTGEEASKAQVASERAKYGAENSPWKFRAILIGAAILVALRFYQELVRDGGVIWIGVFLLVWVVLTMWMRKSSRARREEAIEPVTLEIYADGLLLTTPRQRTHLLWPVFGRVSETPEFFLLQHAHLRTWQVIPKRAFPGPPHVDWFGTLMREQTGRAKHSVDAALSAMATIVDAGEPPRPGALVTFAQRYTFRDCFDVACASWITRGLLLLPFGICIVVAAKVAWEKNASSAPVSVAKLALAFIPAAVLFIFVLLFVTVRLRFAVAPLARITVSVTSDGIVFTGPAGGHAARWQTYDCFKETRQTFIIWKSFSSNYFIIPKRLISDAAVIDGLRQLLDRELRRSTWFLGA
jgi:hypothetical protein